MISNIELVEPESEITADSCMLAPHRGDAHCKFNKKHKAYILGIINFKQDAKTTKKQEATHPSFWSRFFETSHPKLKEVGKRTI